MAPLKNSPECKLLLLFVIPHFFTNHSSYPLDPHIAYSTSNMLRRLIFALLSSHLAHPVLASLKDLSHCDPLKKDARNTTRPLSKHSIEAEQ